MSRQQGSSKLILYELCNFRVDFKRHALGKIHKILILYGRILTMEAECVECSHFMVLYGLS